MLHIETECQLITILIFVQYLPDPVISLLKSLSWITFAYFSGSQTTDPGPTASASPGHIIGTQILRSYSTSIQSVVGPSTLGFNKP